MSIGFACSITIGFWMFNYEDLPGVWVDTRQARRKLHATCQILGSLFIVLGYGAVVLAHWRTPGTKLFKVSNGAPWSFSIGPNWVRMIHIVIGYAALILVVIQFVVGMLKYRALADDDDMDDQDFSIHETLGNMTYSLGMINIVLGVWLWDAWSIPVRGAITLGLLTSAAFGPRWDGTRGFLSDNAVDEMTEKKRRKRSGGGIGKSSS